MKAWVIGSQMKSKGAVCCETKEANLFLHFGRFCFHINRSLSFTWLAVGRKRVKIFEKISEMIFQIMLLKIKYINFL